MITASIEPSRISKRSRRPVLLIGWIAGIVLLAPVLGGCTERWSQGTIFVLIGLLLAIRPPRQAPPRGFLIALAGLLALILTGFLPLGWFGTAQWREALAGIGIVLPQTLSAQPWVTFESMLLFIGGASWMSWMAAHRWTPSDRISLVRFYSAGVGLFALIALLFYFYKSAPPFWLAEKGFGPFPNRNQTSDFLALGGIMTLACAHSSWRNHKKHWPVWLIGFATILTALIVNESRAGILLLFGGTALWTLVLCYFSRSFKGFAVGASGIVLLVSAFLLFGGALLGRFKTQFMPVSNELSDARILIFKDTLQMISANPWNGIGLGNFQFVSPFFHQFWHSKNVTIHPESDWLWAAAELGWGAVILIVTMVGSLLSRVFPLKVDRRLRSALLVAVFAFACHGLVDVSGHRLGTLIPALFLLGLSMAPAEKQAPHRAVPLLFRGAGLLVILIGMLWLAESWRGGLAPGKVALIAAKKEAFELKKSRRFDASIQTMTTALPWAPLDWELYFSRASARAFAGQWIAALGDFRRARRLQPNQLELGVMEGKTWLELMPDFALPVWRETLAQLPVNERPDFFWSVTEPAPRDPDFRKELGKLAAGQPSLQLVLLRRAEPAEALDLIQSILSADPALEKFEASQKAMFFDVWSRLGDAALLEEKLTGDSIWMEAGWRVLAVQYARQEKFQNACELAFEHLTPPPVPSNLANVLTLQRQVYTDPSDFAALYALYHAQKNLGNQRETFPALEQASRDPNCPRSIYYCKALLHAEQSEWREAWSTLEKGSLLQP
ncbi:MAG: hypothetical protein JWL90_3761 [Chthoniobacteraceae bacterium]|nr:hypothetical protein [Chthoniobacteraceae bacterium]